ncbi:MAG: zf-HC2 domain-containing protein [Deltaproteobacteria bacterium]|nr:zf-HC2 domain-containing protein [Deltaproteobacteria bacterium]
MKSKMVNRLLSAYVDNELETDLRIQVDSHVQECRRCRARVAELRALESRLLASDSTPAVPDDFADRVLSAARKQVDASAAPNRGLPWLRGLLSPEKSGRQVPLWLSGCCTVALALTLGVFLSVGPKTAMEKTSNKTRVQTTAGPALADDYGFEWFASMPPGSIASACVKITAPPMGSREFGP